MNRRGGRTSVFQETQRNIFIPPPLLVDDRDLQRRLFLHSRPCFKFDLLDPADGEFLSVMRRFGENGSVLRGNAPNMILGKLLLMDERQQELSRMSPR